MARILKTSQAGNDLKEIWHYIADHSGSESTASKFLLKLDNTIKAIAQSPSIGTAREELAPHLRSFAMGSYLIFYIPQNNGIEVIRVLSSYRDIEPLFQ